jgi:hypothetical protein
MQLSNWHRWRDIGLFRTTGCALFVHFAVKMMFATGGAQTGSLHVLSQNETNNTSSAAQCHESEERSVNTVMNTHWEEEDIMVNITMGCSNGG